MTRTPAVTIDPRPTALLPYRVEPVTVEELAVAADRWFNTSYGVYPRRGHEYLVAALGNQDTWSIDVVPSWLYLARDGERLYFAIDKSGRTENHMLTEMLTDMAYRMREEAVHS